ncbi:MAG: DNA cytosine methyltransferase, partial [Providencia sp.]
FMLENVKMKKEFEEYITLHAENALGKVFKTLINSSLVSAQNRNRYYWTNFPLTQPEDSNVLLRDIIDFRVNEKLSDGEYSYMSRCRDGDKPRLETRTKDALHDEKSFTLTSNCYKGVPYNVIKLNESITKDGKSYCLTSSYRFGANAKHSITKKQRTLASVTETDEVNSMVHNNILYRKLTPTECARLQTFPDGWCENIISNSQSYKAYGNAWTVDVITHIFECMNNHDNVRRDRNNVRFDNDVIRQSSAVI